MAEKEDKFWTFSKGVGALAATVLGALLISHFSKDPTYPQIGLTGIVMNATTQQPVVDAQITAVAGPSIASLRTDNEGRYSFILAGTPSGKEQVTVDVVAGGFAFYRSAPLSVSTGDNFVSIPLSSTAPPSSYTLSPPPPAAGPSTVPATGGPGSVVPSTVRNRLQPLVLKTLPPNFRKPAESATLEVHH